MHFAESLACGVCYLNDRLYKSAFEFYLITFKMKETFAPLPLYCQLNSLPLLTNSTQTSFGTNLDYGHQHPQALAAIDLGSLERVLLSSSYLPHLCSILQAALTYTCHTLYHDARLSCLRN